jgi:hypothetical protein
LVLLSFDNKLLGTLLSSEAFAGNFFSSKTIYENFDNKFGRQQQQRSQAK